MKIIKKLARWILREELKSSEDRIKSLLQERRDLLIQRNELTLLLHKAEDKLDCFYKRLKQNRKIILPQSIMEGVLKVLPNPNEVYSGKLVDCEIEKSVSFNGEEIPVRLDRFFKNDFDDIVLTVKIKRLDIDVSFVLRKEKIRYNILGVDTEVETCYWDFNFSNIRLITDDIWKVITKFVEAQRNVLTGNWI